MESSMPIAAKRAKANCDTYKVGYGRPPIKSQFKPGQSGNPTGGKLKRASVAADLKTSLEKALNEQARFRIGERDLIMTKAAAGIARLVAQFAEGDRYARRDLIALADKLGVDLAAGQAGAIGDAVASLMSANDEAIIADFLRRHGAETAATEAKGRSTFDRSPDDRTLKSDSEK
jgi:Family of unknown function (DUF5681)